MKEAIETLENRVVELQKQLGEIRKKEFHSDMLKEVELIATSARINELSLMIELLENSTERV